MKKLFTIIAISLLLCSPSYAAVDAGVAWEIRPGGNVNNGGGYDIVSDGGTDYSQQDAAQLSLTDLTTDGAGTGLGSATGGFTAEMVDNIIQITSGTGFTPGWYEIDSYTSSNLVTIDRSAGASASVGVGKVGGGLDMPLSGHFQVHTGGNKFYIKTGTYTLTTNVSVSADCTALAPCKVIGYKLTHGDNPVGDDRPILVAADWITQWDNYWNVENIRVSTTNTNGLTLDIDGHVSNCKSVNSSQTANRYAILVDGLIHNSEGVSYFGIALRTNMFVSNSYAHDSLTCIYAGLNGGLVYGNIAENCGTGIYTVQASAITAQNTLFANTKGIDANSSFFNNLFSGNIFHSNTTGIVGMGDGYTGLVSGYNNYYNNGTDVSGIVKSPSSIALDPGFTDAVLISGTVATTSGGVLTAGVAKDFSGIVDNSDYIWIISGTGVTANEYHLITGHNDGADTLTLDPDPGDSAAGDISWQVTVGHDFSVGTNMKGASFPGLFQGGLSTGYIDIGAIQREEAGASGGGGGSYTFVQ